MEYHSRSQCHSAIFYTKINDRLWTSVTLETGRELGRAKLSQSRPGRDSREKKLANS